MTKDLLSVKEVAARLDVHEQSVRRWIRAGRLRAVRVGGLVRVPAPALQAFLRAVTAAFLG